MLRELMNCAVRQVTDLFTSRNGYLLQPILKNLAGGASRYTGLLMGQAQTELEKTVSEIQEVAGAHKVC